MNSTEIVKKLRALALEIEGHVAPAPKPVEKPAERPPSAQTEVTVGYWKVGETKNGKPYAKLGYTENGEDVYLWMWDEKLILASDPIARGQRVVINTIPWKDSRAIVALSKLGQPAAPKSGIQEEEIPF
jgi:hypothetical protein